MKRAVSKEGGAQTDEEGRVQGGRGIYIGGGAFTKGEGCVQSGGWAPTYVQPSVHSPCIPPQGAVSCMYVSVHVT